MKKHSTVEAYGDPCPHVEDEARGLEYTFITPGAPVQAEGTVQGYPFYFRSRGDRYRFAISEDESVLPAEMTDRKSGFYILVVGADAGFLSLEEAEDIIEKHTDQYLKEQRG